jgi:ATP-dependent Clp protease ATP-binding subunit ClpC
MFEKFDENARRALFFARYEASQAGAGSIDSEHVLLGMLRESDEAFTAVLKQFQVDPAGLKRELAASLSVVQRATIGPDLPLTESSKKVLVFAIHEAEALGHESVGTEHLLLGLLRVGESRASRSLEQRGMDVQQTRGVIRRLAKDRASQTAEQERPHLREYARDLTELAADGEFDPLIGRQRELDRIIQILTRRTKNNPLLIGDAGVGKSALVEGLATRIVEGQVPALLTDRSIVALDLSLLVAGTKYRGQFEERLKGLLSELRSNPGIIVFIDEIHTLIGTGSAEGSLDAANILKPALSRGEVSCIGATTVREYRRFIERDRALSRRFQTVMVQQPGEAETLTILRGVQSRYESYHGVRYAEEAIVLSTSLASRYLPDRAFPDKAIDVLDEAGARVKLRQAVPLTAQRQLETRIARVVSEMKAAISAKQFELAVSLREEELALRDQLGELQSAQAARPAEPPLVSAGVVEDVVASWTGIPVNAIQTSEAERLQHMESILRQRIVGQDEAISAVARAIRRSRLGVTSPSRPIGSFIFLGPSGVGKTELTRQLAAFLFHDPRRLVRFDMSEYMERHTTSRLIGSPPGYVGFEEGGQLAEQIRRNPYSVVLLDEIEKAHDEISNLLLQVLEDGRLTDNYGETVDFTNTIIIMTSNLGGRALAHSSRLGFGERAEVPSHSEISETIDRELRRHFRPEFLNRIDDIIVFEPLGADHLLQIVTFLLAETAENLRHRQIDIEFDPELPTWLMQRAGIDQSTGARPLRRAVQRWVEDAVSDFLITRRAQGPAELSVRLVDGRPVVLDAKEAVAQSLESS